MRYLNIIGTIDDKLIKETTEQLLKFEQEDLKIIEENKKYNNDKDKKDLEDITINITTNGGSCYGFFTFVGILERMKCRIITIANGECFSCGIPLFLMGDERYSNKYCDFMIHGASTKFYFDYLKNTENDLLTCKMQDKRIDDYIISKTNITQDQLDKSKLQCWWFDYDEAIKLGVVNK